MTGQPEGTWPEAMSSACSCRWTFRLGQPIRFPDPACRVHAKPLTSYVVVQPFTLDGEERCFSTTVEAGSIEEAQALAREDFLARLVDDG